VWSDRLNSRGYSAFIVEANIKGQTWYRVRVGPFHNRQEAASWRKVLERKEGFKDSFLTN
ncbi:MAG: SPOR domain-containing protein, partial [Candidatus Binatia bacterium]